MPHGSIQVWMDSNWKPGTPFSKANSTHSERPAVSTLLSSAVSLTSSRRRWASRATASAPAAGDSTSTVRIGKFTAAPGR